MRAWGLNNFQSCCFILFRKALFGAFIIASVSLKNLRPVDFKIFRTWKNVQDSLTCFDLIGRTGPDRSTQQRTIPDLFFNLHFKVFDYQSVWMKTNSPVISENRWVTFADYLDTVDPWYNRTMNLNRMFLSPKNSNRDYLDRKLFPYVETIWLDLSK